MSADGNDRGGVKAPRTLFSLGRPGTKRPDGEAVETGGGVDTVDATDMPMTDEAEIQYACGACGAILPGGASFCGECGTPVALDDDFDDDDGMLDELVAVDAEADAAAALDPVAEAPVPEAPVAEVPVAETVATEALATETVATETLDADAPVVADAPDETPPGDAPADETPSTDQPDPTWTSGAPYVAAAGGVVAGAAMAHAAEAPMEAWHGGAPNDGAAVASPESGSTSGLTSGATDEPTDVATDPPNEAGVPAGATGFAAAPPAAPPPWPVADAASAEPAGVLFADPSIAEPLPSAPMGSFTVSEPVHGSAAEAPAGTDDHSIAPGLAGAAAGGALVGAAVGAHEPAADPAGVGFEGTTASSMPYGTGPVESSATKGRGPLIAAVVVVGLLLIGAIAFALTRGGSNNDVATNSSTTQVPITTAKAPKASSTTEADSSTSSTSTTVAESTTVPDDASTTSTPSSSADVTTPETAGSQTTTPPVTKAPVTTAAVAVISFSGPPDFGIIPKGGSVSFVVSNVGNAPGTFACSANGLQLSPGNGTVANGQSQQVVVTDFRRVEARYSIRCVGGSGRYETVVTVG